MKRFLLSVLLILMIAPAYSQGQKASANASQTINLVLHPTIDLKFTNNNSSSGSTIDMVFNDANKYADGIISGTQELEVRSNENFKISVQADASSFTYMGGQGAPVMPVDNTLFMAVTNNTTGGSVASGFSNYTSLSSSSKDLVINGGQGENRKLVLAYKAKPAMGYPAGTYSVGVIYTATLP